MEPQVNQDVLDRELLDAAADRLLGGMTIDLAGAHQRAQRAARRRRRRAVTTTLGTLIAAAAAVLVVATGVVPGLRLADPAPAKAPAGPGSLPGTVRLPARWEPSAAQSPLTRVGYVLTDDTTSQGQLTSGHPVWLVGADGGQYRWLPANDPRQVSVSPDGLRVAWTEQAFHRPFPDRPIVDLVKVLDVPTGQIRSLALPGLHARGFVVLGTAISPDGHRLAIWGADQPAQVTRLLMAELGAPGTRSAIGAPRQVCVCGDGLSAYGWRADGTLIGPGVQAAPTVPGEDGGLPSHLADLVSQQVLLSADGRTRWGLAEGDTEASLSSVRLVSSSGVSVSLGRHGGVTGLGTSSRGVLVSRWQITQENGGPSDVVIAGPQGVRTLTKSVSPSIRVIAVAASVADGGQVTPGASPKPRVLDLHWYGWLIGGAASWVAGLSSVLLITLGGVVLLALGRRLIRSRLQRPGRLGLAVVVVVVAIAGVVVLVAVSLLTPSVAERPAPAPGGGPVVPQLIADQKLHPPRVYDVQGTPVTRRLTMLLIGSMAGRGGVYGLDAATGALVQVDDEPVGSQDARPFLPGMWALSPNGRYVAAPQGVFDLETARLRTIDGLRRDRQGQVAVLDDGSLVVPSLNSARSVLVCAPGAAPRTLNSAALHGTESVEGQVGRRVLLRFFGAGGSGNNTRSDDRLAAVLDLGTGAVTDLVTADGQSGVLAVTADGAVIDSTGARHQPGPGGAITIASPRLRAGEPAIERLAVGADGTLVAVGSGLSSPTGLLVRTQADSGAGAWSQVAELRLPGLEAVHVAPSLIATAAAVR